MEGYFTFLVFLFVLFSDVKLQRTDKKEECVCENDLATACCNKTIAPDFLLVIPATLTAGTNQTACLRLHNFKNEEPILVRVRLHNSMDSQNYDSFETTSMNQKKPRRCFNLRVPSFAESSRSRTKLAIISTLVVAYDPLTRNAVRSNDAKKILMYTPEIDVYINTDKQTYKPGQTVLFRVLQLTGLYPGNHQVEEITIQDPKNRKLMVLGDLEPKMGLVSGQYALVTDPEEGIWTIQVKLGNKKISTTFEVKRYVLPKYEVIIQPPNFLHVEVGNFKITVCGRYTYGKPVLGSVEAQISVLPTWRRLRRPIQTVISETDETGCAIIEGNPKLLKFRSTLYSFNDLRLNVSARITESLTGVSIYGENTECMLTTRPYKLEIVNNKKYFKPGLPYTLEVVYSDIGGNLLAGKNISVKVDRIDREGNRTTYTYFQVTDKNGKTALKEMTKGVAVLSFEMTDSSMLQSNRDWRRKESIYSNHPFWSYLRVESWDSSSDSFVSLYNVANDDLECFKEFEFAGVAIVAQQSKQTTTPKLSYLINSRDRIVMEGLATVHKPTNCTSLTQNVENEEGNDRETCLYNFEFRVLVEDWTPSATIFVYFVNEFHDVISDDMSLSADCFRNLATVRFDSESVRPGRDLAVELAAEPNSVCALAIVDKSVHLLGGENFLTQNKIKAGLDAERYQRVYVEEKCGYDDFIYRYTIDDDDNVIDKWSRRRKRSVNEQNGENTKSRKRRSFYVDPRRSQKFESFKRSRLLFFTNLQVEPADCSLVPWAVAYNMVEEMADIERSLFQSDGEKEVEIEVRNYFPETWKWELVETGNDGRAKLDIVMPDTITEWVATSYCLSQETGIGVADTAYVKGFKPVFLSMSLPSSVIRGEEITLKSTLFSYLKRNICLEMVVFIEKSEQFELSNGAEFETSVCVCGGDAASIRYNIKPLIIGEISLTMRTWSRSRHVCSEEVVEHSDAVDGVNRILIVEPEGVEEENTINDFICMKNEVKSLTKLRYIKVPDDHYEGSARIIINVIGSVMGSVFDNLDHLIRIPYGCGEQNMVTMVPNIVALKYLTATGQITPTLKDKIVNNILLGYQRQLKYQRRDGSFSAFGESDSSGSTWLTAFVISTFNKAKNYIFIEDDVIDKAYKFIDDNRDENGCVKKVGLVHNKRMMGGIDGPAALHAYVSLAIYRKGDPIEPSSPLDLSVGCNGNPGIKLYTKSIKFYTNALKKKFLAAKTLFAELKTEATLVNGDNFNSVEKAYWSDTDIEKEIETPYWYHRTPYDAVEITSYILLGYLELERTFPDEFPIANAYAMVQWLTSQRNEFGGFSSTQNTVVGLNALSVYAERTYSNATDMVISILNENTLLSTFAISNENALIVQQEVISPPPTVVRFSTEGTGCALVQTSVKYNVPRKEEDPSFTASVHVRGVKNGCDRPGTRLVVACASYKGTIDQPVSNMAVFEVKLVSGYQVKEISLKRMVHRNKHNGLKRYEVDGKKVIFYFRAIGSQKKCAAITVSHVHEIKNVQPGSMRVYDYYDPVKEATVMYNMSCYWENFNDTKPEKDCLHWGNAGICTEECVERNDGFCFLSKKQEEVYDYCSILGNSVCGDTGTCKATPYYYRCSCYEGYKKSRWSNICIRINEVEETEISTFAIESRTNPGCDEDFCPLSAFSLIEGDTTVYFCPNGYNVVENGSKSYCDDIDECSADPCDSENTECINGNGTYRCDCKKGFRFYEDLDESIVGETQCVAIEELNEIPKIPSLNEGPGELGESCPVCLKEFPKRAEQKSIFCPKSNVYILTNTSSSFSVRPIVRNGEKVDGDVIANVAVFLADECQCNTLRLKKFLMMTPVEVLSPETTILTDHYTYVFPKRAWKKVQKYKCTK